MAVGDKEVLLAGTRLPIFFTAAAMITEFRQHFEEIWPAHTVLNRRTEGIIGEYEPRILEDIRERQDALFLGFDHYEMERLRAAGISDEQIQSPGLQDYLSHNTAREYHRYQLHIILAENLQRRSRRTFDLTAKDFDPEAAPHERSDFKFDRRIVRETIVGALLGPGRGNDDATIQYLNRGLPNGARGVAWTHIRTAIEGFVKANLRRLTSDTYEDKKWCADLMRLCVRRVMIADRIWSSLPMVPGRPGATMVELIRLMVSGEIHALYREAGAAVHLPRIDPVGELRVIDRTLKALKDIQAEKLAEEKSA